MLGVCLCVPVRVAPGRACHVAEIREEVGSCGPTVAAVSGRRGFSSVLEIDFARGRRSNSCDSLVREVQSSQVVGRGRGWGMSGAAAFRVIGSFCSDY